MFLTELCGHLRNWFLRSDADIHTGTFTVIGGSIDLPWLAYGQYFRIIGSVFNDGVWQYPASELTDEEFTGAVWALAVPPDVVSLSQEIEEYNTKYRDSIASPYTSESFGGYSYTKAAASSDGTPAGTWQAVFRPRLNRWRKL